MVIALDLIGSLDGRVSIALAEGGSMVGGLFHRLIWVIAILGVSSAACSSHAQGSASLIADPLATAANEQKSFHAPPASRGELIDFAKRAAERHSLPTNFFLRLIRQESGFNRNSVSPAGAMGIAQFMPQTARERGLKNPFNPEEALPKSAELLKDLWGEFGSLGLAAAAYNAGPQRVHDWLSGRSSLPLETRHYVKAITGEWPDAWASSVHPIPNFTIDSWSRIPRKPRGGWELAMIPESTRDLLAYSAFGRHVPMAAIRRRQLLLTQKLGRGARATIQASLCPACINKAAY